MNLQEIHKKTKRSGELSLTKKEVNELLGNIINIEEQALIVLAIYCGIRRSDIVRIRKKDINFKKHTLYFREKKKGDTTHQVFLNKRVEQALKMWLERAPNSKWLFPSHFKKKKTHVSGKTAYNMLQRNLERSGLSNRPFHALRATCVKLHQKAGLTPTQTARIINDSVSTVEKHYSTPSDDEMMEQVRNKNII